MSEWLRKEQAEETRANIQDNYMRNKKIEEVVKELEARISALEEKERARDRAEHDLEMSLADKAFRV